VLLIPFRASRSQPFDLWVKETFEAKFNGIVFGKGVIPEVPSSRIDPRIEKKSESLEPPDAQEDPAATISLTMIFTAFAWGCIACNPASSPPEGGLPVAGGPG